MPAPLTRAQVKAVGQRIYDSQGGGITNPADLARMIASATGPTGAIYAGVTAAEIIQSGKAAVGQAVSNVTGNVTDIAGVVREAVDLPIRAITWISDPGSWLRIAYVIGGGMMIIAGLVIAARDTTAAKAATKAAVGAIEK